MPKQRIVSTLSFPAAWMDCDYRTPIRTAVEAASAFHALMVEGRIQAFMKRTGLKRDEIGIVCNARTGLAYPQWRGAIAMLPKGVSED